jgi:hypothetical protein
MARPRSANRASLRNYAKSALRESTAQISTDIWAFFPVGRLMGITRHILPKVD